MERIKFKQDPFTWIGVRTWPWISYRHVARARGIGVSIGAVVALALVVVAFT